MERAGHPLQHSFATIWAGWVPNPTSLRWMGQLGLRPSVEALANAEAERAESDGPPPGSESSAAFRRAMSDCLEQSQDGDAVDLGDRDRPAHSDALATELHLIVEQVDAALGPVAPYYACMSDAGIEVTSREEGDFEGYTALYDLLLSERPRAPLTDEQPSADWERYLELEDRAIAADADCRAAKHHQGLAVLAPLLDDFEERHRAEIGATEEAWAAILTRARKAGMP